MRPFLITGLPRSRTAWLAHLFTMPGVWCEHEPSGRFESLSDLGDYFKPKSGSGWRIGAADHGLGWWLAEILHRWEPRVLLVERPVEEVYAALRGLGLPAECMQYLLELKRREDLVRQHPNVLAVPFSKLDDHRTMQRAWFHLLPGVPFDESRFEYMRRFNIQLTDDWIKRCGKRAPGLYRECADSLKEKCHA